MLVLFDVDKTLFLNSDPLMGQATTEAIEAVWGPKLPGDAIRGVNHAGQTAIRIAREILRLEGLSDEEIEPGLARWCEEAAARYLDLLDEADTSDWRAPEGTAETLAQIEHRALLTGNPELVARARMERLGLAEFFPPGQGAFGCDAEDRAELIDIARQARRRMAARAEPSRWATQRPTSPAHAGPASMSSASAPTPLSREADEVIERMAELPAALEHLSAAT